MGFGTLTINGSSLGNALSELLTFPEIQPGDQPSYQICKTIWTLHPLGNKMVQSPIEMAQSQQREISIQKSPEERVKDQFQREWDEIGADEIILNTMATSRAYGLASVAMMCEEIPVSEAIDPFKLGNLSISFNVYDPLNTAGAFVLNQDPNAIDFQKITVLAVSGKPYHRSRTVTMMNERPVYLVYESSAFGFVGRSVFQRALFPLKSFIQTMVTDDLITKKAGVFVAMLSAAGAIIDQIMQVSAGLKRLFVQQSTNGNVISIGKDEKIETLNMQNIDGAYGMARKNILENIAVSADMPAKLLNSETFAEGFGEGTEDAKHVARYIDRVRRQMRPLYTFFDRIVQHRAWNEDFFKTIQEEFPEYRGRKYKEVFYEWQNSFTALWPSLLTEPDSEKVQTDDVRLKAIIAAVEVFGPMIDPENKATLIGWAQDAINQNKMLFQSPLELDIQAIADYEPPVPEAAPGEPSEPKPFAANDSAEPRMRRLDEDELADLITAITDETAEVPQNIRDAIERIKISTGVTGVTTENGVTKPQRDRAAYMRGYRARQKQGEPQ